MRYSLFIALFFVSMNVLAQEFIKPDHFIEVTGVAETEIDPNEITLLIRLREFEENKNKVGLEKLDQDFLNALKAAGIDRKKLTLADVGSKLSRLGRKDKDAFREKSYQLILNNAAELEKFLEKLEPVEVDQVVVTKVHNTDYEKYKMDLKVKALQAAKSKAETLLKSIGSETGKPLMVREWDEPVMPYDNANVVFKSARTQSMEAADMIPQEPVAFRKIKLKSQVTAQFEIK